MCEVIQKTQHNVIWYDKICNKGFQDSNGKVQNVMEIFQRVYGVKCVTTGKYGLTKYEIKYLEPSNLTA